VFTDGSSWGGTTRGGGAAVVCRGSIEDPIFVESKIIRGAQHTSSYEAEVAAIWMALDCLIARGECGRFLVCSDSRAALASVGSCCFSRNSGKTSLRMREKVSHLGSFTFQWIPSHCGIRGNEWADAAAKSASGLSDDRSAPAPIELSSAKAYIRRTLVDPPPIHASTREVYVARPPASSSRREAVILAQLRSGHSPILQWYQGLIKPNTTKTCPRCGEGEENLKHFLQDCPATLGLRLFEFGDGRPPLSVLTEDVGTVVSYLRQLRLL
jgi:ribonuclease HI